MKNWESKPILFAIAVIGSVCLGPVALPRGKPINALWIVASALSVYAIAYRFDGFFL